MYGLYDALSAGGPKHVGSRDSAWPESVLSLTETECQQASIAWRSKPSIGGIHGQVVLSVSEISRQLQPHGITDRCIHCLSSINGGSFCFKELCHVVSQSSHEGGSYPGDGAALLRFQRQTDPQWSNQSDGGSVVISSLSWWSTTFLYSSISVAFRFSSMASSVTATYQLRLMILFRQFRLFAAIQRSVDTSNVSPSSSCFRDVRRV